mmetsp:Transcript_149311/g.479463  ORF Transcript_149311/g.479463 Transcript_149311/m.479463 type:complete len:259 (-) Transcript_149311:69-845(-)
MVASAGRALQKLLCLLRNLHSQLANWYEDQHDRCRGLLGKRLLRLDVHNGRQQIREGLPAARLGDADEVLAAERQGQRLRLDRHGRRDAEGGKGVQHILGDHVLELLEGAQGREDADFVLAGDGDLKLLSQVLGDLPIRLGELRGRFQKDPLEGLTPRCRCCRLAPCSLFVATVGTPARSKRVARRLGGGGLRGTSRQTRGRASIGLPICKAQRCRLDSQFGRERRPRGGAHRPANQRERVLLIILLLLLRLLLVFLL